jgi:hypothetical protein
MADFMAEYGSPLLEAAAIVHVVMISEQLLMISAGSGGELTAKMGGSPQFAI